MFPQTDQNLLILSFYEVMPIDCIVFCAFQEKETKMAESKFARRKFCGWADTIVFETTTFRQKLFKSWYIRTQKQNPPTNKQTNKRAIWEWALKILQRHFTMVFHNGRKKQKQNRRHVLGSTYLRFPPSSLIGYRSPSSKPDTKFFRWLSSRIFHSSSSVWRSKGSRLRRRFPLKITGSYENKNLKTKKNCWKSFKKQLWQK